MDKLRVMVAEDHPFMRQAIISFLGRYFEIIGAVHDGKDLVDAAITLLPDVIVSDISMPRLTGLQAMQELSARGCRIPFLFVTSEPALIQQNTLSFIDKLDLYFELVPAIEMVATAKQYISSRTHSRKQRFGK